MNLNRKLRQKLGGSTKNLGGHDPPSPLRVATAMIKYKSQFRTTTTGQLHVERSKQRMLTLCPQTRLLHHKRKKNDQAMLFLVTEESVKLTVVGYCLAPPFNLF